MESEFYYDAERGAVQVNVTGLYGAELQKVLAEVGEEFEWQGAEFQTMTDGGGVSQWMWLHGARVKVPA